MAQQWYYSQGDERQGPVSLQQLKEMAASGQLQPTDLVWRGEGSESEKASAVKGLFTAKEAAPLSQPSTSMTLPPDLPPPLLPLDTTVTEHIPKRNSIGLNDETDLLEKDAPSATADPATLRCQIEELRHSIVQYALNPPSDFAEFEQIATLRAEHARLQGDTQRLSQRQQQLVEAKAEFESLDAARQRTAKDLVAAEKGLKQFARPLGKAAFEALVAGQLQGQPIFNERSALRERIAELNAEYERLAPPQHFGIVQKAKAKAQQLIVAGHIKAEEMTIGKLDEQIGSQLITSSQEQSVACDLTAESLAVLRKQRDLIARCKQESEQAREALETKRQQFEQFLGMSGIESGKSFDAEKRKCEVQIGQAEKQRSVLEQQLPDQLLTFDLGQSNLGRLTEELRQAQTQWEATPDARTASDAFRAALAPSNAGATTGQAKKPLDQVVTMRQGLNVKKKIVAATCGFIGLSVLFCCGIGVVGKAVLPKAGLSAATDGTAAPDGSIDLSSVDYSYDFSKVDYKTIPKGAASKTKMQKVKWDDGTIIWEESEGYTTEKGIYVKHGFSRAWYEEAKENKAYEEHYLNGKLHGPFTGWYTTGEVMWEEVFVDDLRHGITRHWAQDGKLNMAIPHFQGKKHGIVREWDFKGQLIAESHWFQGKANGILREWSSDGQLRVEDVYVGGVRKGPTREFAAARRKKLENAYNQGRENGRLNEQMRHEGRHSLFEEQISTIEQASLISPQEKARLEVLKSLWQESINDTIQDREYHLKLYRSLPEDGEDAQSHRGFADGIKDALFEEYGMSVK